MKTIETIQAEIERLEDEASKWYRRCEDRQLGLGWTGDYEASQGEEAERKIRLLKREKEDLAFYGEPK